MSSVVIHNWIFVRTRSTVLFGLQSFTDPPCTNNEDSFHLFMYHSTYIVGHLMLTICISNACIIVLLPLCNHILHCYPSPIICDILEPFPVIVIINCSPSVFSLYIWFLIAAHSLLRRFGNIVHLAMACPNNGGIII